MAFANMFGMGGSAAASMAMGEKMKNETGIRVCDICILVVRCSTCDHFNGGIYDAGFHNMFRANEQTFSMQRIHFHVRHGAPFIVWSAAASFVVRAEVQVRRQ